VLTRNPSELNPRAIPRRAGAERRVTLGVGVALDDVTIKAMLSRGYGVFTLSGRPGIP
jgi:hypothetical protein